MLTKIILKREELALQWNTRIEVAARLLIIGFSILGTFVGYFIIAGVIGLVCAFFFFCFIGLPYLKLKRAAIFKGWIIISTIFAIIYYTVCFVLGVTYVGMFKTINNYFIVAFILISVCILFIFPSYVLLWREVKKQWVLRKKLNT